MIVLTWQEWWSTLLLPPERLEPPEVCMGSFARLSIVSFFATMTIVVAGAALQRSRNAPASAVAASVQAPPPMLALSSLRAPAGPSVVAALSISLPPADEDSGVREEDAAPTGRTGEEAAPLSAPEAEPGSWAPPSWFPDEGREGLLAIEGMDQEGSPRGPRLHSVAVFVYDVDAGRVLLSRSADDRRPVASLTKLVSALTVASESPDLDRQLCIDSSSRPSWPGARTKLFTGTCGTGWDYLGAAVVQSDNGAAMVLPEVAGLPFFPFVAHMNEVAADLGMSWSSFAEPSGADDDNLSTARDMTRASLAASLHPTVATVASAPFWDFADTGKQRIRRMWSTDRMVAREDIEVLAAKTGYTDTAGYCFTGVFRTRDGHRIALTTLGAHRNRHRWKDVERLLEWAVRS